MLHLSQAAGVPERLKVLPMAGAAIKRKDISRPADAWRNLFMLVLPPLAEGSRGIKKYILSAPTAELQVCAREIVKLLTCCMTYFCCLQSVLWTQDSSKVGPDSCAISVFAGRLDISPDHCISVAGGASDCGIWQGSPSEQIAVAPGSCCLSSPAAGEGRTICIGLGCSA